MRARATMTLSSSEVHEFATGPGFFKVERDRALVLVDDARRAREIDRASAQAELEAIDRGESTADRWQIQQRLAHAQNQLAVAGG